MEATVFNPAQMQLLEMMSFVKSDKALDGLKQAEIPLFHACAIQHMRRGRKFLASA